jgi:hypothetical protein
VSCFRLGRCGDYGWFVVDLVGHSGVFHLVSYSLSIFDNEKKGQREKKQGRGSKAKKQGCRG